MPWSETCLMDEKIKFIAMAKSGAYSFAETCRHFGISRETGYKLMRRYAVEGEKALVPRSRAPHSHPNEIAPSVAKALLDVKARFPRFGPRKVRDFLLRNYKGALPAASTIGELF